MDGRQGQSSIPERHKRLQENCVVALLRELFSASAGLAAQAVGCQLAGFSMVVKVHDEQGGETSLLRSFLMLDDSRHSIALGTAIGMFVGLTPTVGLQMIIVMVLWSATRRLFRFNQVAALLTVYISNPLTFVPIYYGLYRVGAWFSGGALTRDRLIEILTFNDVGGWWSSCVNLWTEIGLPLAIGTAVVATAGGLMTYPIMLLLLSGCSTERDQSARTPRGERNQAVAASSVESHV